MRKKTKRGPPPIQRPPFRSRINAKQARRAADAVLKKVNAKAKAISAAFERMHRLGYLRQPWRKHTQLQQSTRVGDRLLICSVASADGKGWIAIAAETTVEDGRSTTGQVLDAVFDDHTHQVIGSTFRTQERAMRAAEKFADAWAKGRNKAEQCVCGPIKQKHPRKKK